MKEQTNDNEGKESRKAPQMINACFCSSLFTSSSVSECLDPSAAFSPSVRYLRGDPPVPGRCYGNGAMHKQEETRSVFSAAFRSDPL